MDAPSKDLISVRGPAAVQGLEQPGRWSAYGAALGVSATAMVAAVPAVASGSGVLAAMTLSGMGTAAVVGAYLGKRWHRLVRRERGTTTIGRWLLRFAGHGAVWGAAAAWGAIVPAAIAGAVAGAPLGGLAMALVASGAIAGAAGAVVTGTVGVSHVVALTRGDQPWKSLALALVLGPSALIGVFMFLVMAARILGVT